MSRHSETDIAVRIMAALDRLDGRLSRYGRLGSVLTLTAMAASAAAGLHILVRTLEGHEFHAGAVFNSAVEIALIVAPIIFYAREVIA